jgi:methylmalonyl-CoA mutase C-terminal domain/subunit
MEQRKIRVLIGKVGLDGHDRGAKVVARTLKESGMEVIYTGIRQTVDQVVSATIQEDVDVLGLSFLSGDQMVLIPKVMKGLKAQGAENVMVVVGGIILKPQVHALREMGIQHVFLPGTPPDRIVEQIRESVR